LSTPAAVVFKAENSAEASEALLSAFVMDKDAVNLFPQMAMPLLVIDEDVAGLGMVALVAGHSCDDRRVWEVLSRPADLLISSPVAARQTGKDYRMQMPHCLEQSIASGMSGSPK
jgi:hypothetical protein